MMKAVVFDFDGIIVNTEPMHHRAFQRIFEPLGLDISWQDYVESYIGYDDRDAIRERYRSAGKPLDDEQMSALIEAKASAFVDLVAESGVEPYPGVLDLIDALSGKMPVALCSGALWSDIRPVLSILSLSNAFRAIVTADEVAVSKPDPESYRTAVQRLQDLSPGRIVDAGEVMAIEDTPAGIRSAKGAGLRVLAVTNSYGKSSLGDADWIVDSLEGVNVDRMMEWMEA